MSKTTLLAVLGITTLAVAVEAGPSLPARADIERVAASLSLGDLRIHPDTKGPDATGALPGGDRIEIDLHGDGTLDHIEAAGHGSFPLAAVASVMPVALSDPRLTAQSRIFKIDFDEDGLKLEGEDSAGRGFKAEFSRTGQLSEWKTE